MGSRWTMGAVAVVAMTCALALAQHRDPRLSWGPYDFLQKGYRNAPWINDPFYPQAGILHLTGVISGEMAFINGRWMKPGEQVDGYVISSITAQGVLLRRRGQTMFLKMDPMP